MADSAPGEDSILNDMRENSHTSQEPLEDARGETDVALDSMFGDGAENGVKDGIESGADKEEGKNDRERQMTQPQASTGMIDPAAIWQAALNELALQMQPAIYDTWVRDTWVMGYEDGEFFIGIPNAYARDWLENRLRGKIKRTLTHLVGRSVQVTFRVMARPVQDAPNAAPAPLYEMLPEEILPEEAVRNGVLHRQTPHNTMASNENPKKSIETPKDAAQDHAHRADAEARDKRREPARWKESESTAQGRATSPEEGVPANGYGRGATLSSLPERKDGLLSSAINLAHTFETFVVGNHNRLAHAAASAIAEQPGQSFNPLFIYGGVGLGKTHLLHAIGNHAIARGYQMLYCSSEQFTNELIASIRSHSTDDFRNKYRHVDVLLIDDIQFIGGKESTQEEFFHTFNHLHAAGRQVVLSSDRPPKALATLEERLRSRFEGGLQTDISQPDFETRVAILQSKAAKVSIPIQLDVLMLVAERVDSNVRELEGTLNRIVMQARLFNSSVNLALAESILQNLAPQRTPRSPAMVIRTVAEHFHVTTDDLTGRSRTKDIAHARQVAMYLLREENALSLPAIGDQLGGRDHSTVRYGVEKITTDLDDDPVLRRDIMSLREKIYAAPGM